MGMDNESGSELDIIIDEGGMPRDARNTNLYSGNPLRIGKHTCAPPALALASWASSLLSTRDLHALQVSRCNLSNCNENQKEYSSKEVLHLHFLARCSTHHPTLLRACPPFLA